MTDLIYLQGYPEHMLVQVRKLIDEQRLSAVLQQRYPAAHDIASDKALYRYVQDLKNDFLRHAPPINKAAISRPKPRSVSPRYSKPRPPIFCA
jgi:hypothetical protein